MRHVPTALYIDTEVYKRNNLRLDTKDFTEMRKTFVKGVESHIKWTTIS